MTDTDEYCQSARVHTRAVSSLHSRGESSAASQNKPFRLLFCSLCCFLFHFLSRFLSCVLSYFLFRFLFCVLSKFLFCLLPCVL